MGFISYCMSLSLYIMSSCLRRYSVLMNLILYMQAGVGLLVADVMPIYMIMPRLSHNYSLFYQLLDSNLFTHRNTYAIFREATSETYGPRVYLLSYKLSIYFYLHLYFSYLYYKIPKIYLSYHIISIRSHFRKWP